MSAASATATATSLLFSLFLLFFFFFFLTPTGEANGWVTAAEKGNVTAAEAEMVPLIEAGKAEMMMNESRRKLGSFQICALCTCCGGAKGYCLPSPCCYTINCNIPNRPFGFCSFTPKACNCFGCHL